MRTLSRRKVDQDSPVPLVPTALRRRQTCPLGLRGGAWLLLQRPSGLRLSDTTLPAPLLPVSIERLQLVHHRALPLLKTQYVTNATSQEDPVPRECDYPQQRATRASSPGGV